MGLYTCGPDCPNGPSQQPEPCPHCHPKAYGEKTMIDAVAQAVQAAYEDAAKIAEDQAAARCIGHASAGKGVCGYEIAAALRARPTEPTGQEDK